MVRLLLLACALGQGFAAEDGPPFMRLPSLDDVHQQPLQIEALPGFDPSAHGHGYDPNDPTSIVSQYVQSNAYHPDGTPNMEAIRATMKKIAGNVQIATVIPTEPTPERPLESATWRLWFFWAPDQPLPSNILSQIRDVRAGGFAFSQVAVMSLRQWETWGIEQNRRKDKILALMESKDRQRMEQGLAMSTAWVAELGPLKEFLDRVVVTGVPIIPNVQAAITLQVKNVPSWRLVSPQGRVHCLNGIGTTTSILSFCQQARAWEESNPAALQRAEQPLGHQP